MAFTVNDVKALRERTNCGMMDCKNALTDADGDMDKAIELLREKGLAAVAKKSGRIAAEGIVHAEYDENKKVGAMVEVNSETDFVAKNETFRDFVIAVTKTVINDNPADLDSLMNCKLAGSTDTVEEALREKVLTIGENLKIRRFERYEGIMVSYIHGGGRIGVAVCFDTDDATAKKPVCIARLFISSIDLYVCYQFMY
ncbi:MAG: translation elongation factor Ts [Clostridia bacterium]